MQRGFHFFADEPTPFRRTIPLRRAAVKAFPKMRAISPLNIGILYFEEKRPERILGAVAEMLLGGSEKRISLYGVRLPGDEFAEIPRAEAESLAITDDATSLCDPMQKGFDGSEKIKFDHLAVRKCDLKRALKELGVT